MKVFIFGVGASLGSQDKIAGLNPQYRAPLVDQLFQQTYWSGPTILSEDDFQRCQTASDMGSLESWLTQQWEEIEGLKQEKTKSAELAFFDLYKDQHWVEPNGLLIDQQLVAVPGLADRFLRVWAHVESPTVAWNAYAIAGHLAPIGSATRKSEDKNVGPHA